MAWASPPDSREMTHSWKAVVPLYVLALAVEVEV
jgi:hypothetical protein